MLDVRSAGPWGTPPKLYVSARCTCNQWHILWTVDELAEAAGDDCILLEDIPWQTVYDGLRGLHERHITEAERQLAERARAHPPIDPAFYG